MELCKRLFQNPKQNTTTTKENQDGELIVLSSGRKRRPQGKEVREQDQKCPRWRQQQWRGIAVETVGRLTQAAHAGLLALQYWDDYVHTKQALHC